MAILSQLEPLWKPFRDAFSNGELHMVFWDCDGHKSVAFQPKDFGCTVKPEDLTIWMNNLRKGFESVALTFAVWRKIQTKTKELMDAASSALAVALALASHSSKDTEGKEKKENAKPRFDVFTFFDVKQFEAIMANIESLGPGLLRKNATPSDVMKLTENVLKMQNIVTCESDIMFAGSKHWLVRYQSGKWIVPFLQPAELRGHFPELQGPSAVPKLLTGLMPGVRPPRCGESYVGYYQGMPITKV